MKKKVNERCNNLLIIISITIVLPISLNAAIEEDCKDRLMDVFTKICGNDRLKRSIEKFDLKKEDYRKFKLIELIDLSLEEQKKPVAVIRHEKRDVLSKIANSKEDINVVSDSSREYIPKLRRRSLQKPLSFVDEQPYDGMKIDDTRLEITVEELYNFYNNLNNRLPRSFTQVEWRKILRNFVKTCCYEDNICDSENIDTLCF